MGDLTPLNRVALKKTIRVFRQSSDAKAIALCTLDLAVFAGTFAGVLFWESIGLKVLGGLIMGLWIARLFIIGHDACHQAFFSNRRANRWMGRVVFLPSLTAYSLWEAGHNLGHHVYTNLAEYDYVWTPTSKQAYDAMPAWRRALERCYRSGYGHGAYYLIELWWKRLLFPRTEAMQTQTTSFTADSMLVSVFGICWVAALIGVGLATGQSIVLLVACGFVLPFLTWNLLMGAVIYFHHTHPDIAWYDDIDEWEAARDGVSGTVLITFPLRLGRMLNNIMEHPAHHLDVRVPLYHIEAAQRTMNEQNVRLLEQRLTWKHLLECTRRCKLYDYAAHRWLDFDGEFTSERVLPGPTGRQQSATNA